MNATADPAAMAREQVLAHTPLVRRIVRGILRHRQDAEDAEQETLVQVLAGLHRFEGRGSLEGYIRRVAVRTCMRLIRRRRFWRLLVVEVPVDPPPAAEPDVAQLLHQALARLSVRERAAFVLKYSEELSFAEIAEAMGCREATARNYAFRARTKLQQTLGGVL